MQIFSTDKPVSLTTRVNRNGHIDGYHMGITSSKRRSYRDCNADKEGTCMFMIQYLKNNWKEIVAILISILPTSFLRTLAYRVVLGYRISHSYIGFGTRLAVTKATIIHSRIRAFNSIVGPIIFVMKSNASMGRRNYARCSGGPGYQGNKEGGFDRHFEIGEFTRIGAAHLFDLGGDLVIGSHTDISGYGSQFWTHGAVTADRTICIGDHCFIGSAVRFAPGTVIGDNNIVGMGSVVNKKFPQSNLLIAGVPAKIVKENHDWSAGEHQVIQNGEPVVEINQSRM